MTLLRALLGEVEPPAGGRHFAVPEARSLPVPRPAGAVPLGSGAGVGRLAPLLKRDPATLRGRVCVGAARMCAELLSGFAEAGCGRLHFWPLGAAGRQVDLIASEVLPGIRP